MHLPPHHMPQAAQKFTSSAEGGALVLPHAEHVRITYGDGTSENFGYAGDGARVLRRGRDGQATANFGGLYERVLAEDGTLM